MARHIYCKASNGEVFERTTPNDYKFAVIAVHATGATQYGWNRRYDLALKVARISSYMEIVDVLEVCPDGICGHCGGTGEVWCSKCHGKIEGDNIRYDYERDAEGHIIFGADGHSIAKNTITGHWVCTCKTGKVKCRICKDKGIRGRGPSPLPAEVETQA